MQDSKSTVAVTENSNKQISVVESRRMDHVRKNFAVSSGRITPEQHEAIHTHIRKNSRN